VINLIYAVPVLLLYFVPQSLPAVFLLACGLIIFCQSFFILKVFTKYEESIGIDTEQNSENDDDGIFEASERMEKEKNN
jgi:hypothetical protein